MARAANEAVRGVSTFIAEFLFVRECEVVRILRSVERGHIRWLGRLGAGRAGSGGA